MVEILQQCIRNFHIRNLSNDFSLHQLICICSPPFINHLPFFGCLAFHDFLLLSSTSPSSPFSPTFTVLSIIPLSCPSRPLPPPSVPQAVRSIFLPICPSKARSILRSLLLSFLLLTLVQNKVILRHYIIHFPTSLGVSKVSERANE